MHEKQIAHYQITGKLGAGGMGEVYRARDTKLNREVAIKVLPEAFASNKERLARFQREATALAQLNHPHIAAVHGFDQSEGQWFLSMELVEGDDLSKRLKSGAMPIEEALEVCRQIAEALEAAHQKGIIHRDLKPGNLKLTEDAQVKVLDFGLAKTAVSETASSSPADSMSPTITADFTTPGTLLGTAAYMSPEQARGKAVDKRSDIWSFGCVLYECLTGKRMFQGEDTTETLATIIKSEPDWSALPGETPPTIHLLLRKCLAKDRRRRLQDIGDARVDLEQAINNPGSTLIRLSEGALEETRARGMARSAVAALVVVGATIAASLAWHFKPAPELPVPEPTPRPIRQLKTDLGVEGELQLGRGRAVQLSPDGTRVAYIVNQSNTSKTRQLYVRRLEELNADPEPVATDVSTFCFSPDGNWIAFTGSKTLSIVPTSGGSPREVYKATDPRTLHWVEDDSIIVALNGEGLAKVSPSPVVTQEPATFLVQGGPTYRRQQLLPGADTILYLDSMTGTFMVQRLPSGKPEPLVKADHARYVPDELLPGSGYLVYSAGGTLFATVFDLAALRIQGQPVPVVEGVVSHHFDISPDGTLVYVNGTSASKLFFFEWIHRDGKREELRLAEGSYGTVFSLSPDGRSLAYTLDDGQQEDIWIYNIDENYSFPLTHHTADDFVPVWSPSGKSIAFSSQREGTANLYWKRVGGDEEPVRLTTSTNAQYATSWHPEGRFLAITKNWPNSDLKIVHMEGNDLAGWTAGKTEDWLATPSRERNARFSPDGHWLAYTSDESKKSEIYVRAFPGKENKKRISMVEGQHSIYPRWSQRTGQLAFATLPNSSETWRFYIMDNPIQGGITNTSPPNAVQWPGAELDVGTAYDLHPDGDRLLLRKPRGGHERHDSFVLFENFIGYLRAKIHPSTNKIQ